MQTIVSQMLERCRADSLGEERNALKEVVQEVALCGLSRAGFFKSTAFYGGTALRIFYGLDRFSEDLDFSLIAPDPSFDLKAYFPILESEIRATGLNFTVEEKVKSAESNIRSAFLKGNTKEHILSFFQGQDSSALHPGEIIRIKFEVDIDPPAHAAFESKYRLLPSPYEVRLYDLPSLFAGKIHAVLCRAWKNRVKGRDLYDYVFYLAKGAAVNLKHLKERLVDSGFIGEDFQLDQGSLIGLLNERFASIDYEQAKQDVLPFIKDKSKLNLWSAAFFTDISKGLRTV
ncbi:TPA: nucleotidyl transferase AbiEii/AbiGii toxin family protein [Candidatus Scatousia excrementigallinarum]|uniref:Nucleotidyl transferase AbiEii/AbiGii toxin family protein n=1 Tax=Candidatus Scatousia excrementigallinarum TaxID=2840935 RepID=A0A9D1EYT4_9BACT|nr:nucleotidyl transferase AbiEii/AbiGii toxin family protein [Candidatus Scatousia excrementigallinarum]